MSFVNLYWKIITRFNTFCYFLLTINAKIAIISFFITWLIYFSILESSLIRSAMIASYLAANFTNISRVEFIVLFTVSFLSDILSYCQQNNFRDGHDVMSILSNFLLVSQTYGLCDRGLSRYISLVVTLFNTVEFVALGIHMFLNYPIFCVCFFFSIVEIQF